MPESSAAQPVERPTDCTEVQAVGATVIGHDCGEWASILISGRIVLRRPWSRTHRASHAVRVRAKRERGGTSPVAMSPAPAPSPSNAGSEAASGCHPAYNGCLPIADDLDCVDIDDRHVTLVDPANDPYGLDVQAGVGNGITCDDEA